MELSPKKTEALADFERANGLSAQGRYSEAIEIYNSLVERYPISWFYHNRGVTYYDAGLFKEAISDLTTAIELDDDDADYYFSRGNVYLRRREFEPAIRDYNTAIELQPKLACAYNSRGYAYRITGRYDDAREDFKTAIALDNEYVSPLYNFGLFCLKLGEPEEALDHLNRAVQLQPDDPLNLGARGDAFIALGELQKAHADITRALEIDPETLWARQRLAWMLSTCSEPSMRNGAEAKSHALWCCEKTQWKNAPCLETLSAAYSECGEFAEAIHWEAEAIRLYSGGYRERAMGYMDRLQKNLPIRD